MLQDNIVDQLLDYFEVVLRHCGEQVIVAYNAKVQLYSKLIYVCNESCCLNGATTRLKILIGIIVLSFFRSTLATAVIFY